MFVSCVDYRENLDGIQNQFRDQGTGYTRTNSHVYYNLSTKHVFFISELHEVCGILLQAESAIALYPGRAGGAREE